MRIGYHCEGHDYLILHHIVSQLLGFPCDDTALPPTSLEPYNDRQVIKMLPWAIRRLSLDGADAIVVAVDNDGCGGEVCYWRSDSRVRTRHSHHVAAGKPQDDSCRWCRLDGAARAAAARHQSADGGLAPPPTIVCVPVETIEAWLLIARGIVESIPEYLGAEHWLGGCRPAGPKLKELLYGWPGTSERSVNDMALPLLDRLPDVRAIGDHSESFRQFADQVLALQVAARRSRPGSKP